MENLVFFNKRRADAMFMACSILVHLLIVLMQQSLMPADTLHRLPLGKLVIKLAANIFFRA
jgi:hypothetical protein